MSSRFAIVPARALDDTRLRGGALKVLLALGTYCDRDGWCWPAMQSVADRVGVTRQAVQQHIRDLEALGYVQTKGRVRGDGGQTSNAYRVIFDADLPPEFDRATPPQAELAPTPPQAQSLHPPQALELAPPASSRACTKNVPMNVPLNAPLPDWLPKDAWDQWVGYRSRELRKPLRPQLAERQIQQLAEFMAQGDDPSAVIQQSMRAGWTGLFPLKGRRKQTGDRSGFFNAVLRRGGQPTGEDDVFGVIEGRAQRVG